MPAPDWLSIHMKQRIGRETVRPSEIFRSVDIKERIDSAYLPFDDGYAVRRGEGVDLADTVIQGCPEFGKKPNGPACDDRVSASAGTCHRDIRFRRLA